MYSYYPQRDEDLELIEGTEVEIVSTEDPNWYRAISNGKKGYVPANYLQEKIEPVQFVIILFFIT